MDMRTRLDRTSAAALVVVACVGVAALATPGASAGDLESLRARAQLVADQVSAREHDLERLESRQVSLTAEIAEVSSDIGLLELELHRAEAAHQRALQRYVDRAVEAYMDGSTTHLALLLSATDMNQLFALAEATVASAAEDVDAVQAAVDLQAAAEQRQLEVDERKQKLLAAQARVDSVEASITNALSARRQLLARLTADIAELERQAREAAALAPDPDEEFLRLLGGSGPSLGIPAGYVGTGVTFEGLASWYGPGFEGNYTASGDIFDSSLYTAASKELPLGTWLFVQHNGRGVVVLVNDRGPYVGERILDLSRASADAIGLTGAGVGWVEAEILVKK
ncbi:MAG: septal ring lytic transglycosylase RlpA family protein [Actinomycetota bacterium]|nr:septal ring lytic transglycosylase RlpA family protein [Actinomycetota bacterium]